MKDLYYGDRRDRVKWGALTFLANRYNVSTILQVAYLREHALISLETDVGPTPIPEAVWRQFSNLRSVETLGSAIGHSIVVIDHLFSPADRDGYMSYALERLTAVSPLRLVFRDPDTGIEPDGCKPEHVRGRELLTFWRVLQPGEVLALYQHANHTTGWLDAARTKIGSMLQVPIEAITGKGVAKDVAILWARQPGGA